jgi:uncharacterized protein YecE (DUF72 family)
MQRSSVLLMPLLVGTSGWQYRDWRGVFYPERLPAARWLEHYAGAFPTVENNGTFYRLAAPETFADWRARTPDGFLMAIKASRYLTHIRRLRDPAEPVARLMAAADRLGDRLGPVLLQLPPTMRADPAALDDCLGQFEAHDRASGRLRVCVEFRHPSWWSHEIREVLQARNAAVCWADRVGRPLGQLWRTADWGYLRFHEGAAHPWPRYGRQALRSWIARVADTWPADADVFAYFNNDQNAAAPADAAELSQLSAALGFPLPQWPAPNP